MEASVFSDGLIIGSVDLKIGDYYMGGLFGIFTPNDFYLQTIQSKIQSIFHIDEINLSKMQNFNLTIELSNGYLLDPIGGIVIYDIEEIKDEPIEIELAGVACDVIDLYFERDKHLIE